MSSEDLVAYLRARLDEEGQIARTVFDGHRVNNPGEPRLAEYGFAFECEACSNGDRYGSIEYPCSTIKAVASALGVETAD